MSMMATLQSIESWLRVNSPPTADSLQPRATQQQLDEAARFLDVQLPADLACLYLWHDGATAAGAPFEIAPTFSFMSLERALDAWTGRNQLYRRDLDRDSAFHDWQPHWLPIGVDICGDYVVVETAGETAGRIFESSFVNGACIDTAWSSPRDWAEQMLRSLTADRPFREHWRRDTTSRILTWRIEQTHGTAL
ncbi:hypothetical protein Rhe02_93280 [Rhizocola hellebori]|uniref:Knr4/Smi1-like domain-containing protein n=1 Tax=Rhizocola hellebori TaxID=1392758 RepID=A0A8J3VMI5_9ACTN|nr:SMI1/KNR4 family protein [Rhizocola hellebori]GIH11261.1 hypothetical protein Rhe02_93280 [Rhizocola hellebori]